jgi:hypothetical protein
MKMADRHAPEEIREACMVQANEEYMGRGRVAKLREAGKKQLGEANRLRALLKKRNIGVSDEAAYDEYAAKRIKDLEGASRPLLRLNLKAWIDRLDGETKLDFVPFITTDEDDQGVTLEEFAQLHRVLGKDPV